jgi:hypothetical protein
MPLARSRHQASAGIHIARNSSCLKGTQSIKRPFITNGTTLVLRNVGSRIRGVVAKLIMLLANE